MILSYGITKKAEWFNPDRFSLAVHRRAMTLRDLSAATNLPIKYLDEIYKGCLFPDEGIIKKIADALGFPEEFFYADDAEVPILQVINFISAEELNASELLSAQAAAALAAEIIKWASLNYKLPSDQTGYFNINEIGDIETAASLLRWEWKIGEKSVKNLINFLENKGVFFFSMPDDLNKADAFSFWLENPCIFVNINRTAEQIIFAVASALSGLLSSYGMSPHSARKFAAAFLMPEEQMAKLSSKNPITADIIIKSKLKYSVSAFALAQRLYNLEFLKKSHYENICSELSKRGYSETEEPSGLKKKQSSLLWKEILEDAWQYCKKEKSEIARDCLISLNEFENLVGRITNPSSVISVPERNKKHKLFLIKSDTA